MASVNYAGFYKDFDTDIANTFKYVGVVANSDSQILFVATDDEPRTSGGIHVGRVVDHTIQYADTHARSQILYPHLDNMQALTIKERTAGNDVFYIKDNGDTSISGTLTVSTDVGKTLTVSGGNLQSGGYGEFEGLVSNGNIDVRKGGQIVYRDSGGNRDFMIQNDPSNLLKFQRDTGSGEQTIMAMRKDNGNVGIGNINPTEKLDVDGNIKASGIVNATAFNVGTDHTIFSYTGPVSGDKTDRALLIGFGENTDRVGIGSSTGGKATFEVYDENNHITPNKVVVNGANVGIGTTSPTAKLHVSESTAGQHYQVLIENTDTEDSSSRGGIKVKSSSTTNYLQMSSAANANYIDSSGTAGLSFYNSDGPYTWNGSDSTPGRFKMRLTNDGKLGIGVDPPLSSTSKLQVTGVPHLMEDSL